MEERTVAQHCSWRAAMAGEADTSHVDMEILAQRKERILDAFKVFDLELSNTVIQECVVIGPIPRPSCPTVGHTPVPVTFCMQRGAHNPPIPGYLAYRLGDCGAHPSRDAGGRAHAFRVLRKV